MTVYVDSARNRLGRMLMSHMVADTEEELHAMANKVGLRRAWFQNHAMPHYDLCQQKRHLAIENGAVLISNRQLVALIRQWRAHQSANCALENASNRQNCVLKGEHIC